MSTSGAYYQLVAHGQQDSDLTSPNGLNFIKGSYEKYVNFSTEQIKVNFNTPFEFGKTSSFFIPKRGDMLHKIFLFFDLPALVKGVGSTYAGWTNDIGRVLPNEYELYIGGNYINTQDALFQGIREEVSGPDVYEDPFSGKVSNAILLQTNALNNSKYMVQLPFWFCKSIASAFPLLSLNKQEMEIRINARAFTECVTYDGTTPPATVAVSNAYLMVEYVYLDDQVKAKLKSRKSYEIPMEFISRTSVKANVGNWRLPLRFNFPTKELLVVARDLVSEANNDWYNYSVFNTVPFTPVSPIITEMELSISGLLRYDRYDEIIYRNITRYSHKNRTDKYIYCMPFCEYPEDEQPSGALNFSKMNDSYIDGLCTTSCVIYAYGVAMNWGVIQDGKFRMKYIS